MNIEDIILSEISQIQKNKYCVICHLYELPRTDLEGMAREHLIHSLKALHSIASNQVGKRKRDGRGQDHEIQWSYHILLHPEAANLLE